MSLSNPKTITEVFAAHNVPSGRVCVFLECQELALAVNLQGKYSVNLQNARIGIECSSWLRSTPPQHARFRETFRSIESAPNLGNIHLIREHLNALLADSATNGSPEQ